MKSLAINERAPDIQLFDERGRRFHLHDALGVGPVIIWCSSAPDEELKQLRAYRHELEQRRARVFVTGPVGPYTAVFILDRDGVVRWRSVARHAADEERPARVVHALTHSGLAVPGPSSVLSPLFIVAAVTAIVGLGALAAFANDALVEWDTPVLDWILGISWPRFNTLMRFSTDVLGDRFVLAPLTLLLGAVTWHRCRQMAAVFVAALPVGLALEFLIKAVVQRPRPLGSNGLNSSFPSGHVIAAVVFWGLLPPLLFALTRSRWMWRVSVVLAAVIVIAVAVSRVYLSAHWPSDAVGGILTGAVVLLLAESALHSHVLECSGCPLHPLRYGRLSHAAIEAHERVVRGPELSTTTRSRH